MKDEVLKLALDSLIHKADMHPVMQDSCYVMHPEALQAVIDEAIKQALADSALDKKAENARELGLDYEPVLKDNSNYRYDPPVAEPVAWMQPDEVHISLWKDDYHTIPLYTTPPAAQRTWTGLTDEEIEKACVPLGAAMLSFTEVARAIEAKLKEKNT